MRKLIPNQKLMHTSEISHCKKKKKATVSIKKNWRTALRLNLKIFVNWNTEAKLIFCPEYLFKLLNFEEKKKGLGNHKHKMRKDFIERVCTTA